MLTVTATDASTNLISTVSGGFHCLYICFGHL